MTSNNQEPSKNESASFTPFNLSTNAIFIIIAVGVVVSVLVGVLAGKREPVEAESAEGPYAYLVALIPWALILLVIYFFVYRVIRARSPAIVNKYNNAVALIDMNYLDEAEAILREIEKNVKSEDSIRDLWLWHTALIQTERGQFTKAVPQFQKVLQSSWLKQDEAARMNMIGALAQYAALFGDVELAESTLQEGRGCELKLQQGALLRAQVILHSRKKDYAGAAHLAQQDWRLADTAVSTALRTRYRVVWAFALQQLGEQKNAEQIGNLVAGAKPFWKSQFHPLVNDWPEMEAFLKEHRLTDDYATA
jgi:tetratricopeptide (TPR) repeat protein